MRKSHENPYIISFYKEFLGVPNGRLSHELLHTKYVRRGKYNEFSDETFVQSAPEKKTQSKKVGKVVARPEEKTTAANSREELESVRVLNLEAENKSLKHELEDTLETVDILKRVIADYAQKK